MTTIAQPRAFGRAVRSLHEPRYRWWFLSQTLSASGTMTQAVAQSWLVLTITGHAIDLGWLGAVSWAPVLVGGLWAGNLVDRVDRRRLLIVTQSVFIAVCAAQAILVASGVITLWMIFVFGALGGMVNAVDSPARQVYVRELVGTESLAGAIGLFEVIINASRVLGPAIGGVLLATIGIAPCFAVNGLSFVPVLLLLLAFRPAASRAEPHDKPKARVIDGLRAVRADSAIRACIAYAAAGGMLFNLGVGLPILTSKVFGMGGGGFGAMISAFGLGALPGAILAAGGIAHPTRRRIWSLALSTGVAVLATAFAPNVVVAFAAIALTGFCSIWLIALANTMVMLRAGAEMQGRVMGIWSVALPGLIPFTGLLTSWVAQAVNGRAGFALAGVAMLVAVAATTKTMGVRAPSGSSGPCG